MKRPILVAIIGYIIGIIVGLYLQISVVPFYIAIIAIYEIYKKFFIHKKLKQKLNLFSIKRYFRYIKIFINSKIIIVLIIVSTISNTVVLIQNKKYEKIYEELSQKKKITLTGIIISNKEEKQYYNKYKIKIQNQNLRFYIIVDKNIKLEYGDKIKIVGEYKRPEIQRNYKGFDYSNYLKQLKVYGTIKASKIEKTAEKQTNIVFQISNKICNKIINNTQEILDDETSSILLGLILGYKNNIDDEVQENFRNASMAHILAVSGMHIAYVVLGVNILLRKMLGKRKTYILSICVLIFYMFITNFAPSVTRAGIMGILMLFSKIIYRKNDIYTSMAISLFCILIYNPFLLLNAGLQLSYGGVIGIIFFNKQLIQIFKNIKIKNKIYKYKIRPIIQKHIEKIEEIISISISVQLFILPIIISNLNTLNPYFLLSNLILSIIAGPIVIIGFLFILIILINTNIAKLFTNVIKITIKILIYVSNISKIPFSKIYIPTPNLFQIVIYYIMIGTMFFVYKIYFSKTLTITQIRIRNLIALIKIELRKNRKKIKKIIFATILVTIIINVIPKKLKIYFIDVGQGDSTFIVTPQNKTILIDGGGSVNSNYDVGKNTLLPYLLDRGFNSIDFIVVSHFDNDHVRRFAIYNARN